MAKRPPSPVVRGLKFGGFAKFMGNQQRLPLARVQWARGQGVRGCSTIAPPNIHAVDCYRFAKFPFMIFAVPSRWPLAPDN